MTVKWRGDQQVRQNIEAYGRSVQEAVRQVANYWKAKLEEYAKENAPWTDQTANARQSLRAYLNDEVPEKSGAEDAVDYPQAEELARDCVQIFLSHGMTYGKWLELKNSGRYAIIWPTIERFLPEVQQMLQEIFAGGNIPTASGRLGQ